MFAALQWRARAIGLVAVVVLLCSALSAASDDYMNGKVVKVGHTKAGMAGSPSLVNPSLPVYVPAIPEILIESGDTVYVALCMKRRCIIQHIAGESVQFRVKKKKLFIKKDQGKDEEFELGGTHPADSTHSSTPSDKH